MTSSTHSFAYSYGLVKKCIPENLRNFKHFITSLFFNRFSSGFHCFVQKILLFLLKSKLDQLRTSPLRTYKCTRIYKPVSFLDFRSPNRSRGGMHGGSHWIARASLEIGDVLVKQWLNLCSLDNSLGTSRDKRETTKETVLEWQQWQPPCKPGTVWWPKTKKSDGHIF